MAPDRHIYAVAIGSNRPRSARLTPAGLVAGAMEALSLPPFDAIAVSPVIDTPPLGPSQRRYANAAMLIETALEPEALLTRLKAMEKDAGRRRGQPWSARPLDLDIIWWSGGAWAGKALTIPHPAFRERAFVLLPLSRIAPCLLDPLSGLSIRHLLARLRKARRQNALPKSKAG